MAFAERFGGVMRELQVVHEDEDIIVLDKKTGLAVQGGERVGASLDDLLEERLGHRPFLIHRLDKDTSGLIIVAKNKEAAARYSALLAGRAVRKVYLAVCAGRPSKREGIIDDPVSKRGEAKEALTRYRLIAETEAFSLLELELGTGRMHQIRVHLAGIGHPILGDDKYGDFALNKRLRKELGVRKLLLHARRLVIPHAGKAPLDLTAPLPEHFEPCMAAFGLDRATLAPRAEAGSVQAPK
jgi:23S rRNA pseudouridine955/2504/2580 synthase